MHRNHDEVDALAPDERLRAIAKILAAGVLRLHARAALAVAETPADSRALPNTDRQHANRP